MATLDKTLEVPLFTEEIRKVTRTTLLRTLESKNPIDLPGLIGYDRRKVYALGVLAQAVQLSTDREWIERIAVELLGTDDYLNTYIFCAGGADAIIVDCRKYVILAWRGADTREEWNKNINIDLVDFDLPFVDGGCVHEGFKEYVDEIWPDVCAKLTELTTENQEKQVYVTGHSLGGAAALISVLLTEAALGTHERTNCLITFGQPKCLNRTLRDYVDRTYKDSERYFRYTHNNDMVPRLPPLPHIMHCGTNMHIVKDGSRVIREPNFFSSFWDRVTGAFTDFAGEDLDRVGDHSMSMYWQRALRGPKTELDDPDDDVFNCAAGSDGRGSANSAAPTPEMTEELREADRETLLRVVRENDSVEFPLERKFDKKKSYALGVLSHAAYQSNEPEWLRTVAEELLGTDIVKQVYVSVDVDAEAVLFDCKDFAIVVWRGSTSVGDWLRNFDIRLTDFTVRNVEGRVHQGFINHTELGWTKIRDLLMPILEAEPDKQVVFAGHSLGGASALVSAILFERDMDDDSRTNCIITFGQPRCFDETICRHIDRTYKNSNRYWRYTHNNDIIPFIPKRPYSDAGVNMYITAGGDKIIVEPNFWFRFRDRVAGFGEDLLDGEGFADHNILLYWQRVWRGARTALDDPTL